MLQYSTVKVNVRDVGVDGDDENDYPDETPITGSIDLMPQVEPGTTIQYVDEGRNKLLTLSTIRVELGPTGDILHLGRDYVKILAPTEATTSLERLQWKATFVNLRADGKAVTVKPIYFYAVVDGEINLADHINVAPNSTAIQLARGPQGFSIGEVSREADDLVVKLDNAAATEVGRVSLPVIETVVETSYVGAKIFFDTDGTPYFDPNNAAPGAQLAVDTDGVPYIVGGA